MIVPHRDIASATFPQEGNHDYDPHVEPPDPRTHATPATPHYPPPPNPRNPRGKIVGVDS